MALINTSLKDYLDAYDGYDSHQVGIGLITPNIYATPSYQKTKIQNLAIGLISEITYSGSEHDRMPLIVPIVHESAYNTILAYNLHYVPEVYRRAIMRFILMSNDARIRNNQPLMIDYHALKRAVPVSQYIVRRYKLVGINVIETHQLVRTPEVIAGSNRWDSHFKVLMG